MHEMLDRRRARRPHRRLPRRADHADPRPRPAQGPRRSATPAPSCARWRTCLGTRRSNAACRIVANAGGLNPAGLADAVRALADRLGLDVAVAHVEGDDLRRAPPSSASASRSPPTPTSARSGIAECLRAGRRRRRHRAGHRRLAGRRAGRGALRLGARRLGRARRRRRRRARHRVRRAGHRRQLRVLHRASPTLAPPRLPDRRDRTPTARASSPSTPAPAARSTVGTVTAQLLYEIAGARYAGPDVTARFDTDRARRGRRRPGAHQRRARRAAAADAQGRPEHARRLPQRGRPSCSPASTSRPRPTLVRAQLERAAPVATPTLDARAHRPRRRRRRGGGERAAALRRARTRSEGASGRAFTGAAIELALASYPGFHVTAPPGDGVAVRRVQRGLRRRRRTCRTSRCSPTARASTSRPRAETRGARAGRRAGAAGPPPAGPDPARCRSARSPARAAATRAATPTSACGRAPTTAFAWLAHTLDRRAVPAAAARDGRAAGHAARAAEPARAELRRRGLLGEGVASNARHDPQAKALGEWLRSRVVDIPEALLD